MFVITTIFSRSSSTNNTLRPRKLTGAPLRRLERLPPERGGFTCGSDGGRLAVSKTGMSSMQYGCKFTSAHWGIRFRKGNVSIESDLLILSLKDERPMVVWEEIFLWLTPLFSRPSPSARV